MAQLETAEKLAALHVKGDPLILFNVWDAATAIAAAKAGAKAIATGSHSVAGAQGFDDGEQLPLDLLLVIVERIAASISLPLTIDFEGGYAVKPHDVKKNVEKVIRAGAVGINFEDQIIGSDEIYSITQQQDRIAAAVEAGEALGIPIVVNARTDFFLKESSVGKHASLMDEVIARGNAYAQAGAKSFFVPGLTEVNLIKSICASIVLPVNVMMKPGAPSVGELAQAGVARVSHGPFPFIEAMITFENQARPHF